MASSAVETRQTPPYLPWKTFKGFLESLQSVGLPARIDPSVMRGMSGSAQSQMRTGMRFLDLIDDAGVVRPRLRELVEKVGTENWKEAVAPLLTAAYSDILKDLDIRSATLHQLNERFKEAGNVEGSVREKAVRFYLSALSDAGVPYSAHLNARPNPATSTRTRPRPTRAVSGRSSNSARSATPAGGVQQQRVHEPQPGTRTFTLPIPGKPDAMLTLPEMITEGEWEMIDFYMRKYISLGTG